MTQNKRLPPYARQLIHILNFPSGYSHYAGTSADGTRLTFWVLIGNGAWKSANNLIRQKKLCVVIPPDENPEYFNFSFLTGHDPCLLLPCGDINKQIIKATIASLMRDGICRVLFLGEKKTVRFLREEVKDVA